MGHFFVRKPFICNVDMVIFVKVCYADNPLDHPCITQTKEMKFYPCFLLSVFFLIAICIPVSGQTLDHKLGEFLIKTDYQIKDVLHRYQMFEGERTRLRLTKKISPHFNMYRVAFDHVAIHENRFLEILKKDPLIEAVQYNHIITYRTTPNDPQFDNQWQYINTGQSGGTAGADIDMDLAWDVATGGITALGDTIVAAVIDDGLDWNHSDFGDNLWINHDEIPDNGIDDDNNGYVDDVVGWDADSGNDDFTGGWHGTPVAGIVGAKGNNGIGVAGVNWDVKLMIIQGGGDEAQALSAYAYCYAERQIYNSTGGAEGSFVVSTNASWGLDQGQPADAPLWCGFYDTMGAEGIISCGATANAEFNIDVVGDLPTGCPSDFLISVTNMNDNDVKVNGAGYGLTTIDLGAFGERTWTTDQGDTYGGFGGTSGATPHVTGAVALLYAAPCPSFSAFAKADPAAAALKVKNHILDGVDPNASLNGITVTGGRLNVANSINELVNTCDPGGCFTPYGINEANLTDTNVDISWNVGEETTQTDIRYQVAGSGAWTVLNNQTSPVTLTGLMPCAEYEFQAMAICDTESTDWSNSLTFQTDGCCEPPSSLNILNITDNGAGINWTSVLAATSYDVRYKESSSITWMEMNINGTSMVLANLEPCTGYEIQIQTNCAGGVNTGFTEGYSFTTTGCGACIDNAYCPSNAEQSDFEWIETVTLNTLSNNSGNDGGYGDYTGMATDLTTGQVYNMSLTPGFDGFEYGERYVVWIDYNHDGDFNDPNETVYASTAPTDAVVSFMLVIPEEALDGPTRMRVAMRFDLNPELCVEDYDFGEVEDYCVNIINNIAVDCGTPTNITISNTTETNATFAWDNISGATSYELRYRESGTMEWMVEFITSPDAVLSNLNPCADYEYQLRSVCDTGVSNYSILNMLTTVCPPCGMPTGITITDVTETSVLLDWNDMDDAIGYEVRYKEAGTVNWSTTNTTSSDASLTGLIGCTEYELGVKTICDLTESSFADVPNTETSCINSINNLNGISFNTYPNPVVMELTLEMEDDGLSSYELKMSDVRGRVFLFQEINTEIHKIDMRNFPSGVYFLQIKKGEMKGYGKIIKL